MRVRVVWFGRPGRSPYEQQVADYRTRVSRRWPSEDIPLRTTTGGRERDPGRVLQREAEALRRAVPDGWPLVVLDGTGESLPSDAFASSLQSREAAGSSGVVFAIGSDLGLDPAIRRDASQRLSLGLMTLPHLLARLILWEQLFRATDILGGGGYHRP